MTFYEFWFWYIDVAPAVICFIGGMLLILIEYIREKKKEKKG